MTEPDVRWTRRADPVIAEVAEALVVPTDCIMSVRSGGEDKPTLAFYTLPNDDPPVIWAAALSRDAGKVLRVDAVEPRPGMWERMQEEMGEALEQRLGPPEGRA